MPEIHPIHIERKPNQKLQPQGDFRQKVARGTPVRFDLVPPLTGLVIQFKDRSPFGLKTLNYGQPHTVTATFDAQNPANNVYPFDCSDPTAPGSATSLNGGEVEILPSLLAT